MGSDATPITPLPRHRGQYGGISALAVLVAASAVVWWTHPRGHAPSPIAPPASAAPVAPAAAAATVAPREPTPIPARVLVTGTTTYDGKRTARVFAPVRGFVVKIHARKKTVRRGDALVTLHSPDIILAERALLAERAAFRSQADLDNARRRLARWGMPWADIARVEQTGKPRGTLTLRAAIAGTVVSPPLVPGLYVEPPRELFTVTDPKHAWVLAELPAADAPHVRAGTPATLRIGENGAPIETTVAYVYRSGVARFELARAKVPPDVPVAIELELDGAP